MKFLHTADLHLDSAFCADTPSESATRREHQRQILKKIFATANGESCDMILIAGDLFDSAFVTPETQKLCISLFAEFGKPVVISPGNHDPYVDGCFYKSSLLPENVFVFTSQELQYFDFPELDVTVAGYAFTSQALLKSPLDGEPVKRENGRTLLLCAHTELDAPTSRYAPIQSSDIARYGFDYAALGHVHNVPETAENIRYCGFPEGRSFDEQGDGGVLIVTADGVSAPIVEQKIISELRYLSVELPVDEYSDATSLEAAICSTLKKLSDGKPTALRLELVGVLNTQEMPDLSAIETKKHENIISLKITDSTFCLPDKSSLEKDTSLRGEFYRELRSRLFSEDREERATALRALKIGLAAIDGKDFTDGGKA